MIQLLPQPYVAGGGKGRTRNSLAENCSWVVVKQRAFGSLHAKNDVSLRILIYLASRDKISSPHPPIIFTYAHIHSLSQGARIYHQLAQCLCNSGENNPVDKRGT